MKCENSENMWLIFCNISQLF